MPARWLPRAAVFAAALFLAYAAGRGAGALGERGLTAGELVALAFMPLPTALLGYAAWESWRGRGRWYREGLIGLAVWVVCALIMYPVAAGSHRPPAIVTGGEVAALFSLAAVTALLGGLAVSELRRGCHYTWRREGVLYLLAWLLCAALLYPIYTSGQMQREHLRSIERRQAPR